MKKTLALAGLIVGSSFFDSAAQAAPINGTFSIGLSSGSYAGTAGNSATAATAIGLDFGQSAIAGGTGVGNGYGTNGSAVVYNANGNFAALNGTNGSIADLALNAGGASNPFTQNPLITLGVYTFQVTNAAFDRSPLGTSVTVRGTGIFSDGIIADNASGGFALSTSSQNGVASNPYFTFTGNFFTIAGTTAAVPEPATWGMMMLGVGAIGVAMRRKKVVTRIRLA